MNLTPSSKAPLALVVLALLVAAAAPAVAVSASADGVPDRAEVGERVSATFTLTELYTDYENWTLEGMTALDNATWTITRFDNRDRQVGDQRTVTGGNVSQSIGGETDEVRIRLEGHAPEVGNYSYDPAQTFTFAELEQSQEGGTTDDINSWPVVHYTPESEAAREAIDVAGDVIDEAADGGADTAEAEGILENAISSYENANFGNAEDLASNAEETASESAQSAQRTDTLLLVGGAVVVLAVLGGLGYLFLQRRKANQYDKLG